MDKETDRPTKKSKKRENKKHPYKKTRKNHSQVNDKVIRSSD